MSGSFLRNGGRVAHQFLFNRHSLTNPNSRSYFRPNKPLSSNFKDSSSSSLLSSSSSSAATSISSSCARSGFVGWYLGMIEARPILTKSLTAGAIFTAADVSSQVTRLPESGNNINE